MLALVAILTGWPPSFFSFDAYFYELVSTINSSYFDTYRNISP